MFLSKQRPIVTPQREHARLAGILASYWGNEEFEAPPIPFERFVTGVTVHDRGYEPFDTAAIPDSDDQRWLHHQRQSVEEKSGDAVVDLIVALHVRRLLQHRPTAARLAYARSIEPQIAAAAATLGLGETALQWCDSITHFCDSVAFDFCFEVPRSSTVTVYQSAIRQCELHYSILDHGRISVSPWPFKSTSIAATITAYALDGYPNQRSPTLLEVSVVPSLPDRG
ncbi:MAG: DUF3891 family protein [Bdellovibrionales bacterium]|nr:DUF3891 family protein [Bdellovibrionales bacterium]